MTAVKREKRQGVKLTKTFSLIWLSEPAGVVPRMDMWGETRDIVPKKIPPTLLELYLHQTNTETEDLTGTNNSESVYSKNVTVLEIYLERLTRKFA